LTFDFSLSSSLISPSSFSLSSSLLLSLSLSPFWLAKRGRGKKGREDRGAEIRKIRRVIDREGGEIEEELGRKEGRKGTENVLYQISKGNNNKEGVEGKEEEEGKRKKNKEAEAVDNSKKFNTTLRLVLRFVTLGLRGVFRLVVAILENVPAMSKHHIIILS
jgi:hypothetical protein